MTANNSLKKAAKLYKNENAEIRKRGERAVAAAKLEAEMVQLSGSDPSGSDEKDTLLPAPSAPSDPELQKILDEERTISLPKVYALSTLFVLILTLNLLKGGGAFSPLGIRCGSDGWWFVNVAMLGSILLFMHYVRRYLVNRWEAKARTNYKYVKGDIRWSPSNTLKYPAICTVAGFVAGMFGVGGGIVKGPLMLAMNVHPVVSGATSATMILYTSFTATTSFLTFGLVVYDYAFFSIFLGFCATFAGQVVMTKLMEGQER